MLAVIDKFARAGILKRTGPAPQPRARFENHGPHAMHGETRCRSQPGETASNDDNLIRHAALLT